MSQSNYTKSEKPAIHQRFRGFLPVVVDVETAGFNAETDALLEVAAITIGMDKDGMLYQRESVSVHVEPFPGANLDQKSLDFIGVDPYHPFRIAKREDEALDKIFTPIRAELKQTGCSRAILVGHNPFFDLGFLNAAIKRSKLKSPFHAFSSFDTATLGALAYGQTVLARSVQAAGLEWDDKEAHSALYDTERTAALFCKIMNTWNRLQAN